MISLSPLAGILFGGLLMSAIALVGSLTLLLSARTLDRLLVPMVAFAAGSLLGGAFFHMLPGAVRAGMPLLSACIWLVAGFAAFFLLEQFLHWRHCRVQETDRKAPVTYLVLIGDGLHNFLGGLAIGGAFLIDPRLGATAWLAAVAHEVPQELGDFAVLVHGGWSRRQALLFNVLSGSTFLLGGLIAYLLARQLDVTWLVPFAAGNFIYIGASDLIPEVNRRENIRRSGEHLLAFLAGLGILLWAGLWLQT